MHAPSAPELLWAWERGLEQGSVDRGLVLLSVACPGTSAELLAELSVGQRDSLLLAMRDATFGSEMTGLVACARCGQQLEMTFRVADVRTDSPADPLAEIPLEFAGYDLRLRLPSSQDLRAASRIDPADCRQVLLGRCLLSASADGRPVGADQLPEEVVKAAADRLSQADPQADVQLNIRCPSCRNEWRAPFDIVSFFWSEIEAWAARLLREVHVLALAYGWHERDILALSPARRRHYLEMVGAWATF